MSLHLRFYQLQKAHPDTEIVNLLFQEKNLPSEMDSIIQLTCGALNNPTTRPIVIFIDAVNQVIHLYRDCFKFIYLWDPFIPWLF